MTSDALFEQLKHPNPNLQVRARQEIARTRDETTIPRLMGILGAEDVAHRRSAVKALGVIGPDAVPTLIESLHNSENPTVRASCVKGLAQVAVNHPEAQFPSEGIDALKTVLNDDDPVVYIASAMALGAIGGPAFDSLADVLATTDNIAASVAIVNALGGIDDNRVEKILSDLSEDESADSYVRETAVSALSRLEMVRGNSPR